MKTYKVTVDNRGFFDTISWYKENTVILHREDGPAIEYSNGTKYWYLDGKIHRLDGPAVECANGDKHWYQNGNIHREDGPAVECANGNKYWYLDGKLHRLDGPAVEYANGDKCWYLDGVSLTEIEFINRTKKDIYEGKVVEIEGKKYKLVSL